MKTEVSLCIRVPKRAYEMFEFLSSQNGIVRFVCLNDREVMFTADMLDFSNFGSWNEINDFLEEVE